jgi:8-oxo-dGTP diphosphatase
LTDDELSEREFLAGYSAAEYPAVAVTVDVVVLTVRDAALHVLLVRRGEHPYRGRWALPGGFLLPDESLDQAAARELADETGLPAATAATSPQPDGARVHLEQLATYGDPGRDPRMRVVTTAYLAFAPDLPEARAGSDAAVAAWVPVSALGLPGRFELDDAAAGARPVRQSRSATRRLAFDHARILLDGLERCRAKLEYTPLATSFVTEPFTLAELRGVYEAVWDEPLHPPNFRRKVLSVPGFVESVGDTTERGGPRGGPRAALYRAGDARLLHPPMLRSATEERIR